jgi:hypothetical protein
MLLPYRAMNVTRAIEIARRTLPIIARCYAGAILCFFAFIPAWILFHGLADIISDPRPMLNAGMKDLLLGMVLLALCAAVIYFLLLLAYRAFTGRGRKKDGGLLPPVAMRGFAAVFALCGAAVSALGIERGDYLVVGAGLFEFLIGAGVFKLAAARARKAQIP